MAKRQRAGRHAPLALITAPLKNDFAAVSAACRILLGTRNLRIASNVLNRFKDRDLGCGGRTHAPYVASPLLPNLNSHGGTKKAAATLRHPRCSWLGDQVRWCAFEMRIPRIGLKFWHFRATRILTLVREVESGRRAVLGKQRNRLPIC